MAKSKRSVEKEEFWRLVLDEYQRSGLTARAFCEQQGISAPSFYAWRRKIQKRDSRGAKLRPPIKIAWSRSTSSTRSEAGRIMMEPLRRV